MIVQNLLIIVLFSVSFGFLIRRVYKSFAAKSSCQSCAGACSTIDFDKIEKDFKGNEFIVG